MGRLYYPEVEDLLKRKTGCARVIVFDHTIRIDDLAEQQRLGTRMPVPAVHNDFSATSAPQRLIDLLGEESAKPYISGQKRFMSMNVWRPLVDRVETKPLVYA